MRPWFLFAFLAALLLGSAFWNAQRKSSSTMKLFEPAPWSAESNPVCPWRDPEKDLARFFPESTGSATETRVLSGLRVELTERLGRRPEPDENALTVHRVFRQSEPIGAMLMRRVKGEHGAIEIALAVDKGGKVSGMRLQRIREPEPIAIALQRDEWLARFRGRIPESDWSVDDAACVPAEARESARAISKGVQSLLILYATTEGFFTNDARLPPLHH